MRYKLRAKFSNKGIHYKNKPIDTQKRRKMNIIVYHKKKIRGI